MYKQKDFLRRVSYYYKIIYCIYSMCRYSESKMIYFFLSGLLILDRNNRNLDIFSWRQVLWKAFYGACVLQHVMQSQLEVITVFIRWLYYKYELGLNHKQSLYVCFWMFWLHSANVQIGTLIVWCLSYSLLQTLNWASGPMCLSGDKFFL